jgi:hypothetical protein
MRRIVLLGTLIAVLLIGSAAMADMEAVQVGYGSLILGGVFQAGFTYHLGDEVLDSAGMQAMDRASDAEFLINFARLAFKGMIVDDKIRYFVQLDLNPEDPAADGPQLLDAKLGLMYIPYTTLWAGRLAPNFTYFNPLNVALLGLIDYPLMNQYLGVQRQTGIEADINTKWLDFSVGVTNGLDYTVVTESVNPTDRNAAGIGNRDWNDENTMKDVYVSIAAMPIEQVRLWGGYWYGNPLDYHELSSKNENKSHNAKAGITNGGIAYFARFGLSLMGEFMYSQFKFDNDDAEGDARDEDFLEVNAMSYYGRLGFNLKSLLGIPLEFLVQYDWLDPDLEDDEKTHGMDNELTYFTGGLNYYIKDWHAVFATNYLYKDEAWKVAQKDGKGEQTGIDDNELKFQVQVAF